MGVEREGRRRLLWGRWIRREREGGCGEGGRDRERGREGVERVGAIGR